MKLTEFCRIYVEKQNAEYTLIYRGNKSKNLTVNYLFFFQLKSLLKTLHLLGKKHKYQYLILASLILVACYIYSVSHVSTIQLRFLMYLYLIKSINKCCVWAFLLSKLYPALVQFEQSKCIDWLNVCYLRSLTKV